MNTHFSWAKNIGIGVFMLVAFFAASAASAQVWRSAGLTGGDVRALALDPRHSNNLYLGTTDGHIFGSIDSGTSWKLLGLVGKDSNAVVTSLIIDPRNSSRIYASTWTRETTGEGGGVFISDDDGATWHESGLRSHAVRALAQAPSNPDELVAGALDGIFISRDGGSTWTRATAAGDAELRNFDSLAIDPYDADIIYAGTFHLPWKTIDGGRHWLAIHGGMIDDSDVLSLALDETNPRRIFASACSGIYRSDSSGAKWEKIEGIPYSSRRTLAIRQDPAEPVVWYAGTTEGLWKSDDAGKSWARISPADWIVNALLLEADRDLSRPSRLVIGTERQGVVLSDDGGAHFRAANDGFYHRRVLAVAVDERDSRRVTAVLSNSPEAVVLSEDGGATWTAMDNGLAGASVRSIYSVNDAWWAAVSSGGLARYDATRQRWMRFGIFLQSGPSGALENGTPEAAHIQPAVNDVSIGRAAWFAATEQGLFESRDRGKSWAPLRFAPAELPVQSVRTSVDGRLIRIVSSRGMVFSDDAGRSWTWHDLPLESGGALKLEWADESTLLAVAQAGVYISRDAGRSWAKEQAGLPGTRAQELLLRPGLWLASMESSGLYASRDEGLSWSRVRNSSTGNASGADGEIEFPALAAAAESQKIFAGSASEGLYLLEFGRVLSAAQRNNESSTTSGH